MTKRQKSFVLAISGGVDSVVLLDMICTGRICRSDLAAKNIVVAHVNHGIRPEAAADERFVRLLCAAYDLPFVSKSFSLGADASEDVARAARYGFLQEIASAHDATIVTAHHLDDLVETVAINLTRGTGIRGLAVLNRAGLLRPLLNMTKGQIYEYAVEHRLEWVEDETNLTENYLRNRLRRRTSQLPGKDKRQLYTLREKQIAIIEKIEQEAIRLLPRGKTENEFPRGIFIMSEPVVARELLRAALKSVGAQTPTRPHLDRALIAIKAAKPGTVHQLPAGVYLRFSRSWFIVMTSI